MFLLFTSPCLSGDLVSSPFLTFLGPENKLGTFSCHLLVYSPPGGLWIGGRRGSPLSYPPNPMSSSLLLVLW